MPGQHRKTRLTGWRTVQSGVHRILTRKKPAVTFDSRTRRECQCMYHAGKNTGFFATFQRAARRARCSEAGRVSNSPHKIHPRDEQGIARSLADSLRVSLIAFMRHPSCDATNNRYTMAAFSQNLPSRLGARQTRRKGRFWRTNNALWREPRFCCGSFPLASPV